MTKKDYIKLAQALKDVKPVQSKNWTYSEYLETKQWNNTVLMIADTLKQDSPRFDRERFLHACGYN